MQRSVIARRLIVQRNVPSWRSISTVRKYQPEFDPFAYTQGRWLDRDQERRDARQLHFDFDALLDVAIRSSPGARQVISCEKREGGFNRVFMVGLDNRSTVVARLPTRIAGPSSLATLSEVATLDYVRKNTTVPVPNVLAWSAEKDNAVGAEYMIMDAIPGVCLKDVWRDMRASDHIACIRSIGLLCSQLCELSFPAYGSIYQTSHAPPGSIVVDDHFSIGPLCAPQHWGCGIDGTKQPNGCQGPWTNVEDYSAALIARNKTGQWHDVIQQTMREQLDIEDVKLASGASLMHPDLHTRNIFVDAEDHTKVTGIIDWQSAAVEPAFVFAADTPDFAQRPHNTKATDLTQEEQNLLTDMDFCSTTWVVMQQTCDKIRPASALDPLLLRVLAAPSFGWTDQDVVLETLLNDLAEDWKVVGLPGESVYTKSQAEDVVERLDEYQGKRQTQDRLTQLLRCDDDGWVANDRWEEVLPRYRSEYKRFVDSFVEFRECVTEEDKAQAIAQANRMWPYDQR